MDYFTFLKWCISDMVIGTGNICTRQVLSIHWFLK